MPTPDSTSRRRRALLALLFYVVATLLAAAPLPLHFGSTVARAVRQDVWLNVWALAWTSEHLFTPGRLFDANIFWPHTNTLAYTDHFIGEALLAAPLYWISGSAVAAYNLAWVAALALTAWGGYLWVRALIGDEPAGEAAALVAGAVCLLVPGKRTALSHLQVMSLQGVTLSLFAAHMLLRKPTPKRALGLGAAALYAGLCSWYTAAYTALLLPIVGAGGLWIVDREAPTSRRRKALASGVATLLLVAVLMVPVALPFRAVQRELSFERPFDELVATSLTPVDYLSSWSWLHEPMLPDGSGAGGYFPGFLALALALLGVRDGIRRGDRWPAFYAAAAGAFAVLALGPRLSIGDSLSVPMPYALLYRLVPGFDALRNPYRAAFFASLLLAVPVGYGARRVIEWGRGRVLVRQRWRTHPRLGALQPVTWTLAVTLALVHLIEAWPGPQQVAALPQPPSDAYEWLAEQPGARALVWPLPRPFDDNARYQLWTVGSWTPLVNGHSGLYPPDFVALYGAGEEQLSRRFVDFVKEQFPVNFLVAHYGLTDEAATARDAAAANPALEIAWTEGDDVVYRVANGAEAGWLRRRLPTRMMTGALELALAERARGCTARVLINDRLAGESVLPAAVGSPGVDAVVTASVPLSAPPTGGGMAEMELYLVDDSGAPHIDLRSALVPTRVSSLRVNGALVLQAPALVALVDASSGALTWMRGTDADAAGAGAAVREALAAARPGDELLVAVAEAIDYRLIERLRLLLDGAGAPPSGDTLSELATTFAFHGTVGAPAGSAREALGEEVAELLGGTEDADCRVGAVRSFTFVADGPAR